MPNKLKLVIFLALAAIIALPAALTCAPAEEEEVEELEPLLVGNVADITGPIGWWNTPRTSGLFASWGMINENEDGIAGREVVLDWYDSTGKVDKYRAGYDKIKAHGVMMSNTCGSGEQLALQPTFDSELEVIFYTCATIKGTCYPIGVFFTWYTTYSDSMNMLTKYINDGWDYAAEGRNPRVAILAYESPYGHAYEQPETFAYMEEMDVDYVGTVMNPFTVVDAMTPIAACHALEADWIATTDVAFATLPGMIKINHEEGWDMKFFTNPFSIDPAIVELAGAENLNGLYFAPNTTAVFGDKGSEVVRVIEAYFDEVFTPKGERCQPFYQAYLETHLMKATYEETIERLAGGSHDSLGNLLTGEPWQELTPEELAAAWEQVSWYELMWTAEHNFRGREVLTYHTVDWSRVTRSPTIAKIMGFEEGEFVFVTGEIDVPLTVSYAADYFDKRDWVAELEALGRGDEIITPLTD